MSSVPNAVIANLEDIEFGDRVREEYGDLTELAESISKRGLIQPLAVVEQEGEEKKYKLLAGGRRYKALELKGITSCHVRIYPVGLSELEVKSIELAENIHRKDFEWREEVHLKREIHNLQQAIHGKKISTSPDATGWSMEDTANLLGTSKAVVSSDIAIANIVDQLPELFEGCKNKSEAAKIIKSVEEDMLMSELAKRAEERKAENPGGCKQLMDCYILKDFFEGVSEVPSKTINFVELDPPYGINLKEMKAQESTGNIKDYNEVDAELYPAFMTRVLGECYRVMSDHSWMVVWFGPEPWFEQMYTWITAAGFKTNRMCPIWIKRTGQTMAPASNLANCYEMFFLCRKGSPALIKQGRSNIFDFTPVASQKKIHPTERPIELIEEILATTCSKGSRIMVPFLGSGNTLIAAYNQGMVSFGYDLSKEYKDRFILKLHKGELS